MLYILLLFEALQMFIEDTEAGWGRRKNKTVHLTVLWRCDLWLQFIFRCVFMFMMFQGFIST